MSEPAWGDQGSVTNAYKTLNRELGLPAKLVAPSDHIARLVSAVEAYDQVHWRAQQLAERAEAETNTVGVNPSGFAAACLYVAGRERRRQVTQAAVAEAASVTANTVRTHSKTLAEMRAIDVDAEETVSIDGWSGRHQRRIDPQSIGGDRAAW